MAGRLRSFTRQTPTNLTDRVSNVVHKTIAGSLIGLSVGGLAFLVYGLAEIFTKAKARQAQKGRSGP